MHNRCFIYARVSNRNSVARNCAELCGIAQNSAELRWTLRNCAELCGIVLNSAELCWTVRNCSLLVLRWTVVYCKEITSKIHLHYKCDHIISKQRDEWQLYLKYAWFTQSSYISNWFHFIVLEQKYFHFTVHELFSWVTIFFKTSPIED